MIIRSKAPLRLGLAGGGSDVSPYSDIYGGLVLNATINLYTYCTIEEIAEDEIVINSYDASCFKNYHLSESLEIDGEAFLIKGVYNRIIRDYHSQLKGFRITTYNDAPIGSGLGTSSSMVVCILKAFIEWLSLPLGDYETSRLAYEIERKDLGLSGGKQDQYAAAFGGFNYMEFLKEDLVIVNPLKIKRWIVDELEASIVLYFTGASRSSAKIINEQKENTSNDISNPMIQEAFDVAIPAGAMSGKVSGAGGGGFIMFMVEPTKKKDVISALSGLSGFVMPFQFTDGGAHGWKIYESDRV